MGIYQFNKEDAIRFAQECGTKIKYHGDELQLRVCPYCKNMKDTYKFAINLQTGQFNCKRASCGAHGNMITLARDFNFSLGSEVDEYFNHQKRYRDIRHYPKPTVKSEAVEYMEGRGISKAITEKYQLTVRKDNDGVLVFPFYDENKQLQFIKYRNMHPKEGQNKEWCEAGCKPILFGMNHCNAKESDVLVLTEGQIDSLSVAEAFDGKVNAVSVPTGANGFTWVPYCWDFLTQFNTLVVFGDHEHDRITLLDEMRVRFHGMVKHVRPEDYQGCKDANELLLDGGKIAVQHAVINAVPVKNPKIVPLSDAGRIDTSQMTAMNTGIGKLNKITGGFFFGQLILLTGERGYGKSTLASQFAVEAVNQGYPAMIYSGELMDWHVRMWIERQMAGDRNIITSQSLFGYKTYDVRNSCLDAIEQWYDGKVFLYDNAITADADPEDDENETLTETLITSIKQYGCKVLIVDNLMTAIDDDMRSDLYRQQTAFVRTLSRIAKAYNVIVILVVHPRKRNGNEFSNDDVLGSGNITNLADTVIRYTMPAKDASFDEGTPDRVLQIFKNRMSGRICTEGIPLWYQESSKRISSIPGVFDMDLGWERQKDGFVYLDKEESDIPFN